MKLIIIDCISFVCFALLVHHSLYSLSSLVSDQDAYGSRGMIYDYGRGRGRGRGFARGRGRGRSYHTEKKSVDDLDAELDKYRFEAMQIK